MRKFAAAVLPASALAASALGYDWNRRAQLETTSNPTHHKIVIVGGGSGGVTVASQLQNKLKAEDNDVCIVEPSTTHYYQPLWTLVGGGQFGVADSCKPMSSVIPKNTRWIQDHVAKFKPDDNQLELASGKKLSYDFLVVATGIQSHFDYIPGLKDTIGENGVCSIYDSNQCERVFDSISKTSEGTAIFTVPSTPIKCGGAPQKIMYLAEDYWREKGLRSLDQVHVTFAPAGPSMFPVKHYGDALNDLRKKKGIEALFSHELVEVDGPNHVATFKTPTGNVQHKFSMLHVVPLMKTPLPLRESPLVNAGGFVEVDKHTTQSTKYPNVFSLGDCSSLPTSKTAAAITSEAPVLVENLVSTIQNRPLTAKYDGYTSCPIIVGTNKLMLAEFYGPGYGGAISETFPWDQRNPTSILFYLKKYFFPWAYWNHMLAGRWYGRNHFFPPEF